MREQLSLSDVVPVLRADLKIGDPQPGRGESEIRVEHPVTAKALMLKGFEVSLARMLNGRRTAEEVLSAAGQIGLPLSLDSFNGFLHKLHKEGFLTELPAKVPDDITTWEARAEWNEEIRRLFQEALREARADRFVAAKSRLDALLARAPATKEAQQLLHWVMQRLRPGYQTLSGKKEPSFHNVFAEVERSWFAEGDLKSQANERAAMEQPTEQEPTIAPVRSRKGLVIGLLLVAVVAGVLLFPLPRTVSTTFTLVPRSVTPITIERAGTLSAVNVAYGQWVTQGTALAQWDIAIAQRKVPTLESRLAEVQKKIKATQVQPKKLADAKAKLDHADATARADVAEIEKVKTKQKGKKSPALTKLEKKLAADTVALTTAQQAVNALSAPAAGNAAAELSVITSELTLAKAQAAEPPLLAPSDGFVIELNGKAGQPIAAGAAFAKLEDSKILRVVVAVPKGETMSAGTSLQLKVGGVAVKVTVEKVEGESAEANLDNTSGSFKSGTNGETSFAGASRSLLSRL